jgi:hypothetical protein
MKSLPLKNGGLFSIGMKRLIATEQLSDMRSALDESHYWLG